MAIQPNTSSDYIFRTNIVPDFSNASLVGTIMLWVNINTDFYYFLSIVEDADRTKYWTFWINSDTLIFEQNFVNRMISPAIGQTGWLHFAFTVDAGVCREFINGIEVDDGTLAVPGNPSGLFNLFTNRNDAFSFPMPIAAYKEWQGVALTAEQITLEMAQYLPVAAECTICSPFRNLDELTLDVEGNAVWQLAGGDFVEVDGPDIIYGSGSVPAVYQLLDGTANTVFSGTTANNATGSTRSVSQRANLFSWTTVFGGVMSAVSIAIQGSLDGSSWVDLDVTTSTTGTTRQFLATTNFIRAKLGTLTEGVQCTVIVVPKYKKKFGYNV